MKGFKKGISVDKAIQDSISRVSKAKEDSLIMPTIELSKEEVKKMYPENRIIDLLESIDAKLDMILRGDKIKW